MKKKASEHSAKSLAKSATGIRGLDEITGGGLPAGRPTLLCGGPGCGKTLLAMEFLVHGAADYGEPGVLMAFEETAEELTENVASIGFDLKALIARNLLLIDSVQVERYEFEETGEYNLKGLFLRLGDAIDTIKAKRVVLDTIEVLFTRLSSQAIVRESLLELFRWLKKKGVTVIMTGERGEGHADPLRPGGIRLRLRHLSRSPRVGSGHDPAYARGQVSRRKPRHQRISVSHRRSTASRSGR